MMNQKLIEIGTNFKYWKDKIFRKMQSVDGQINDLVRTAVRENLDVCVKAVDTCP